MALRGLAGYGAWLVLAALSLACFIAFAVQLRGGQEALALAQVGLGDPQQLPYFHGLEAARMLAYCAAALLVAWRRPRDLIALCAALVLIAAGAFIPSAGEALALNAGAPLSADFSIAVAALVCFYLLFPDGRLTPRWGWLLVLAWVSWEVAARLLPGTPFGKLQVEDRAQAMLRARDAGLASDENGSTTINRG